MKLLIFTACDKVIVDTMGSGQSLIGIFDGLNIILPEATPSNATVPKDWTIFSKWQLEPHEEEQNYTSLTEIFWPDGRFFGRHQLDAMQPIKSGMSFIGRLLSFPIGQSGNLKIVQTLSSDGKIVFGPFEMSLGITVSIVSSSGGENAGSAEKP